MTLTKEKLRIKCLKKLRSLASHNRLYKDSLVNKKLFKELGNIKNKSILIYYPLGNEVDIRKLINKLRMRNNIYLPFMENESFKMVPFRLPLHKKKFNIYEAGNSFRQQKTIDIAIVPTIGVDNNLQRIGFGKGMYDRFFAKLKKKPYTIFIQAQTCYTKEKVCDTYDISCDVLLTPTMTKRKK